MLRKSTAAGLLVFMLAVLLNATPAVASKTCFDFATSSSVEKIGVTFQAVMKEAGICVNLVYLTLDREVREIKIGRLDGAVVRIPTYKNLVGDAAVAVSPPLVAGRGFAVSVAAEITSPADLAGHRVGYSNAIKWQQEMVKDVDGAVAVGSDSRLLARLEDGDLDVILLNYVSVRRYADRIKGMKRVPLIELAGHAWVRRDLDSLIPRMSEAIEAYQAGGGRFN